LRQKEKFEIPLDCIPEGVKFCLRNAAQFCSDAKVLAKIGSYQHALGLCIYAIEELGKAELLIEMFEIAHKHGDNSIIFELTTPDTFYRLSPKELENLGFRNSHPINPFYDHSSKLLYGRRLKDSTMGRITKSFDVANFGSFEELIQAYKKLPSPTYCQIHLDQTTKEQTMYIGFNQKTKKWSENLVEISSEEILQLSEDIDNEISLRLLAIRRIFSHEPLIR
jgi:hypothetical protein